jgi:hypothetical protein
MTEPIERQWTVQDGPDGPVETLTTFGYMTHWLQRQEHANPRQSARDLLIAWCRQHPEHTLDSDPRGRSVYSSHRPVCLDDGGSVGVCLEEHVQADGARKASVRILRLPRRALSWREAKAVAEEILRISPLGEKQR